MTLFALRTLGIALSLLPASMVTASAATIFNFSANVIRFSEDFIVDFTSTLSGTMSIDTSTGTVEEWNIGSPDLAAWTGPPLLTIDALFTTLAGQNSAFEDLVLSFEAPFDFIGFTGAVGREGTIQGLSPFSEHCALGCLVTDATISPSEVPLPAALPLFATGLGALGLLGWRRKRKAI